MVLTKRHVGSGNEIVIRIRHVLRSNVSFENRELFEILIAVQPASCYVDYGTFTICVKFLLSFFSCVPPFLESLHLCFSS